MVRFPAMLTLKLLALSILFAFVNVKLPFNTSGLIDNPTVAFFAAPAPVIVRLYNETFASIEYVCAVFGTALSNTIVPPVMVELVGLRYRSPNVVPPPRTIVNVDEPDILKTLPVLTISSLARVAAVTAPPPELNPESNPNYT